MDQADYPTLSSGLESSPNAVDAWPSVGAVVYPVLASAFERGESFRKRILKALSKDTASLDPEDIHQMRVSLRQLRSCLQGFNPVICLPIAAQDSTVRVFAKSLGRVRDLDIFQEILQTHYCPLVSHKEQRLLRKLLKSLKRQRLENLRHLYALLKGEQYRQFKNAYQHWFAQPHYHLNAQVAFRIMVPDLLLPTLSLLLQHPGWFVGIDPHHIPYDPLPFPPLSLEILQREEPVWHDLRKKIKQFRYQLTLINPYLTASSQETLTPLIQQFKLAQEILGNLQDRSVLRDLLFTFVQTRGLNIQDLATALRILEQEYLDLWHQWQPLQKRYLNPYVRAELRQSIIELG